MSTTNSTNQIDNAQYIAALRSFNAITDKFDVAFDKKRLANPAAIALQGLASAVKNIAEYRAVCRVISDHLPIADDDLKQIISALNISFGSSKSQIKADIKEMTAERNAAKRKQKQDSSIF